MTKSKQHGKVTHSTLARARVWRPPRPRDRTAQLGILDYALEITWGDMSRPPAIPAEEKAEIVLEILSGRLTLSEAARRAQVSDQAVGNWKKQFIASGRLGLKPRGREVNDLERKLRSEVAELKAALGEVHALLRMQRNAPVGRQVRSR